MIALAVLGLALPPWSAIGPASCASAFQFRILCRAVPGQVVMALSSAVTWASGHRVASWRDRLANPGAEPIDALGDVDLNLADQDDAPSDVDDLANPLVAQTARPDHPTQVRVDRGSLESWTGRPTRDQTASAVVRLRVQESSLDDLPTSLCRLTC
ncbi:MAG: hypothetical protein ABI353_18605 [Isosphaeraceae bacterium]